MDFDAAWSQLPIGTSVGVSDGAIEPLEGGIEWKIWRSHNFTGELIEKIDSAPRILRFQLAASATAMVAYDISEHVSHDFEVINA